MAENKKKNTFVWIILGLLVVGLMGFGASGLGGSARTIGSVGDMPITVRSYANAINQEISEFSAQVRQPIGFAQADALGLDDIALQRLISRRALDNEAAQIGLSVDDDRIRAQLTAIPAFRGNDGTFNTEAYRAALASQDLTATEYETTVREEITRSLMLTAVANGTEINPIFAETRWAFLGETRNIQFVRYTEADLSEAVPDPTEEELTAFYEANPEAFTAPEARQITYVWLSPEMLVDTVDVSDEDIDAAYTARLSEFNEPERRLLDRLVFPDAETADEAMTRLTAEEVTFDDLVIERGLTAADADIGDVSAADLGETGADVFAADAGDVVGPLEGDLGPTLYRVNAIFDAQETPVDEAKGQIQNELALEAARRVIQGQTEDINDLLASGAELEEVAEQTEMELGEILWSPEVFDGIAAFEEFRGAALRATLNGFADVERLDDGGLFAIRLNEIVPERVMGPDEVAAPLLAGARQLKVQDALLAEADAMIARLGEGVTLEASGLEVQTREGLDRTSFIEGLDAETTLPTIFELELGEARTLPVEGEVAVVILDEIIPTDPDDPETQQRITFISEQGEQAIGLDLLEYYIGAVLLQTPAEVNEQTRLQLNGSFGNAAYP